ncbi:MAG: hypothetical protein HYT65_02445 [Candidatus Yanofskybacteria bacterium]|nr:hypothetical protein [Candidatus Yanofskybacteria bacterium]
MNNSWKKTLASFIIIGFLVFLPIQAVNSAGAVVYVLKEFGLDLVARVIARTFLSTMTNAMSKFIGENGRDGLPNFVQDWRYFLEDAQYRGEDITRAIIGDAIDISSGTVCQYLRGSLGSAFGAGKVPGFSPFNNRVDSLQYYKLRNRCTLPANFNVGLFRNDFSAGGGWAAWDKLIQPQNNFFGVYADSLDEVERQRSFEESRDRSEAEAGSGFTSKMSGDDGCLIRGGNSSCLVLGSVLTPAKILEATGSQLNTSEFDFITGCDELSECIYNVLSSLTDRLSSFIDAKVGEAFEADTSRGDALMEKARQDCIKAGENTCTEKAKKLDCDASATGGDGGNVDGGGGGGDSSIDCIERIDSGIFNTCMAEVNNNCDIR